MGRGVVLPVGCLPVPARRQATAFSCGAAALSAVLAYWIGFDRGEEALYGSLDTTPRDGTAPEALARVATSYRLTAHFAVGVTLAQLGAALRQGQTVILDVQAWSAARRHWREDWEDGHYVVLVGLDAHVAYVMDPAAVGGFAYLPAFELASRWHDLDRRGNRIQGGAVVIGGSRAWSGAAAAWVRPEVIRLD